ncbi:MAG: GNAT family N-acetyltransferase [Anaerolineae bacterium]|nr:GNAT family N-acetyltransferase [Anaerolineae bacterium]
MPQLEYQLLPYRQRLPSCESLTGLVRLAFAQYGGVIDAGEPFLRWFLARPGLDHGLSTAAWQGDLLASSLFVTRWRLIIGGTPRSVGIVDTVMTHPDHRRRGLARALLSRAIEESRAAGLEALQLYTSAGSDGYRLYCRLGFVEWARLHCWELTSESPPSNDAGEWHPATPAEQKRVRELLGAASSRYDGVPEDSDAVWRWRRQDRPPEVAARVWLRASGPIGGETVTTSAVRLTMQGERLVLSDPLAEDAAAFSRLCRHLAGKAPLVAVADERDATLSGVLGAAGFARGQAEAALVLPLAPDFPCAPGPRPWFALTESIIGA